MYSNIPHQEGSRVVVRRVFLVGPPYLRRGSQICGKTVGRTCLFILITFGVASAMIGVVLFTADLQMVTGFWIVGLILFIIGFLMALSFCVLCCIARRTHGGGSSSSSSLPDEGAKEPRPAPPSSYQLLPIGGRGDAGRRVGPPPPPPPFLLSGVTVCVPPSGGGRRPEATPRERPRPAPLSAGRRPPPPRQYSVCFPIPTAGEADSSSTHPLLAREGGTTPSSLAYSEADNPPPYSSVVDYY